MAKRIRYVHPVDMIAHLWANRSQDSARNAGGNFYFDGDTIYSYGSHFPIARHVETKRGRAVLFTTRDYSVTTSGHKWAVLRACRHLTVFHVQHPTDSDRKGQFDEYRQRDVELARKYSRREATDRGFSVICATWWTKQTVSPTSSVSALGCPCPPTCRQWKRNARQSRNGNANEGNGQRPSASGKR